MSTHLEGDAEDDVRGRRVGDGRNQDETRGVLEFIISDYIIHPNRKRARGRRQPLLRVVGRDQLDNLLDEALHHLRLLLSNRQHLVVRHRRFLHPLHRPPSKLPRNT